MVFTFFRIQNHLVNTSKVNPTSLDRPKMLSFKVRKRLSGLDGRQVGMECKVSCSNCPCGNILPGFSPRSVLGHPSLPWVSLVCFCCTRSEWNVWSFTSDCDVQLHTFLLLQSTCPWHLVEIICICFCRRSREVTLRLTHLLLTLFWTKITKK